MPKVLAGLRLINSRQGTGDAIVNVVAYQGDYAVAREELKVIDATDPRQELRCAAGADS